MYVIKCIIPFDMIVDTDVGIFKLIQFTCQGDNKYHPDLMEKMDADYTPMIKSIVTQRVFSNPLSAIMESEALLISNPDKMLEEMMANNKSEILALSPNTGLMEVLCQSTNVADTLKFTVICRDEIEYEEITNRFIYKFNTSRFPISIIVSDRDEIDPDIYGNYYVKDINDINDYKGPIINKNIIVGNYKFNKEFSSDGDVYLDLPKMNIAFPYTERNKFSFVDIYPPEILNIVV